MYKIYGWMEWKNSGEIAGTTGQSKRLEAIQIRVKNLTEKNIKYRVHIQDIRMDELGEKWGNCWNYRSIKKT